jgi:hypothetical protein
MKFCDSGERFNLLCLLLLENRKFCGELLKRAPISHGVNLGFACWVLRSVSDAS